MQRSHVVAVEMDFRSHAIVHERLEHLEHHVEHPAVVDDMNLAGPLGH